MGELVECACAPARVPVGMRIIHLALRLPVRRVFEFLSPVVDGVPIVVIAAAVVVVVVVVVFISFAMQTRLSGMGSLVSAAHAQDFVRNDLVAALALHEDEEYNQHASLFGADPPLIAVPPCAPPCDFHIIVVAVVHCNTRCCMHTVNSNVGIGGRLLNAWGRRRTP